MKLRYSPLLHWRDWPLGRRPATAALAALWAVGALAAVGLVLLAGYYLWPASQEGEQVGELVHTARRDTFVNEIIEQGEVESSNNIEVRCEVKSRNTAGTAILEIVPEGTLVQPGDVLARLDSSALDNELVQQQILANNAEATMVQARNDLEAAEISKREYLEGTFAQEQQLVQSEIFVAEENLRRARQYADYSERLALRGYITSLQLEGDRFAVEKSRNELETARTKLKVLQDFTRAKMLKQFDAAILTAAAKLKSEESRLELEKSNLKQIAEQVAKCTIRAPAGGQVIYANHTNTSTTDFVVEPGAMLRERQALIRLPDLRKMQVKAKINESKVALVRPGMKALVRLDAFGEQLLEGTVVRINEYPEPISRFGSQVKVYAAFIQILTPPAYVKAGLTAETRVQVERLENVLQVPVQAVAGDEAGRPYCLVQLGEGLEGRYVTVGSSNDKFVVVRSGLAEGESVVLNPTVWRQRAQFPEAPAVNPQHVAALELAPSPVAAVVAEAPLAAPAGEAAAPPAGKGSRGGPRPSPANMVQKIFTELDANADGLLSSDEIPADRASRLAPADANADGQIDRGELTAAMNKRASAGETPAPATGGGL